MKELMIIELYKVSHYDIFKIKSSLRNKDHYMSSKIGLPKYCFNNTINGDIIDYTEIYLQFVGLFEETSPKDEFIILFDICYTTNQLSEEISQVGITDKSFNFYQLIKNSELITNRPVRTNENYLLVNNFENRTIPKQLILTYDLNYSGSGDDFESEVVFSGYLDGNLKEVKIWELLPF